MKPGEYASRLGGKPARPLPQEPAWAAPVVRLLNAQKHLCARQLRDDVERVSYADAVGLLNEFVQLLTGEVPR